MMHNSVFYLCVKVGHIWKSVPHKTTLITRHQCVQCTT